MRIAHLSTMTGFYGGEVCLTSVATGMRERGHDVACVVKPDSQLSWRLAQEGIPVFTLPLVDWFEPLSISRLTWWLRRQRIEILHTHLPRDYFIAAVATLGTNICNVGSRHHLLPISQPSVKRPFLSRFQALISVSEAVRRSLIRSRVMDPTRLVTVHNGIDVPLGSNGSADVPGLRTIAGVSADAPVIGCVGRLCPAKGIETLLAAAGLLRPRWPGLKVLLVGDEQGSGEYTEHLRLLIDQRGLDETVVFTGYVDGAAALAAELDVQVVCSRAEPFGMVTLEAMSNAVPVVVTDSGGSPEIVRDGVDGYLVPPGDAEVLALRLDLLLGDLELRRRLGMQGRQRVQREFTRRRMIDHTEAVYRWVLAGARRGEPVEAACLPPPQRATIERRAGTSTSS